MTLLDRFQDPPASYRGKPFWAWNGELEQEELFRQIDGFHQMGFGGYFCHSRTGLETEYLGPEWFALINACADRGQALGLETWLYDEDRWPSGSVGGMLTEQPEYAMKFIRMNRAEADRFQWEDGILAAFCVVLEGNTFRDKRRLSQADEPPDGTVLYFTVEQMADDGYCNGRPYADTLSRRTADRFLELTHEKYKQYCGARFGGSIRGIFTDEPHRGAVMCGTALNNPEAEYLTPYTEALFPYIRDRFGIDLTEYLPELFLRKQGEEISRIKWVYMEALTSLFCENFLKPIYEWCGQNRLIFTGHLLHEDTLTAQAAMMGSLMRGYEFFHYPGLDSLGSQNRQYWAVKQVTSVARQLGKEKVLSELYGCTGWQMNFQDYKEIGDWQALMGVSLRCPHLSWYTMKGENKRDYPASISIQSAWWRGYDALESYFSRLHVFLDCEDCCDTLVINPIESIWCEIEPGWSYFLEATGERAKHTEEQYRGFFHYLYRHHIEFDYADEDLLRRYYAVETEAGTTYLRVGACRYKRVLLYGLLTVRESTLDILREFAEQGGDVVFVGEYPPYIDAQRAFEPPACTFRRCALEELAGAIAGSSLIELTDRQTGGGAGNVFTKIKQSRADGQLRLMLLSMEERDEAHTYTLRAAYRGTVQCYDPRTGRAFPVPSRWKNGKTTVEITLHGKEEKLLLFTAAEAMGAGPAAPLRERTVPIGGAFAYRLSEQNVLPLDMVSFRIGDGPLQGPLEILKADREIRRQLGVPLRGGDKLQPWVLKGKAEPELEAVRLKYSFEAETLPAGCCLIMEQPERYSITVNQQPCAAAPSSQRWVDACFRVLPLDSALLKPGRNEIELTAPFRPSLDLEAVYLYGAFGVQLDGLRAVLTALPVRLRIDALPRQGLPFYGGGVTYVLDDIPRLQSGERLYVCFQSAEAAYVRLSDGIESRVMAFSPYRCDITDWALAGCGRLYLEVMLNRRNTFGPLHILPEKPPAIGPEHFLTEGAQFRADGYSLVPQGTVEGLCYLIAGPETPE